MSYTDDLDECMAKADAYVAEMEDCAKKGYWTGHNLNGALLSALLKSVKFCIRCAKKQGAKLDNSEEFECEGGCIRPTSLERFSEVTKNMRYIITLFPKEAGNGEDNQTGDQETNI